MTTNYRFSGPKYSTSRIAAEVPLELQLFLWALVEKRGQSGACDYLQVFELSHDGVTQKVVHSQEEPTYRHEYSFAHDAPVQGKIYAIDDREHSTMLFADEY